MRSVVLNSIVFQLIQDIVTNNVLAIKGYDTSNNISLFQDSSIGIQPTSQHLNTIINETTVCFRFFNYKILDHQYLLTLGSFFIGTSLSKDKTLFSYGSNVFYWPEDDDIVTTLYMRVAHPQHGFRIISYEIPEWPMNNWNNFCFTLSMVLRRLTVMINGVLQLEKDFSVVDLVQEVITWNDMTIMGKRSGNQYRFSLFGKTAEITIWGNVLPIEEMNRWSSCSYYGNADVLSDNFENIAASNLIKIDVPKEHICKTSSVDTSTSFLVPDMKLGFGEIGNYCSSIGSKMSVVNSWKKALDVLGKLEHVEGQCENTIYSGHKLNSSTSSQISTKSSKFLDFERNEQLKLDKWFLNEPNNYGGKEECVELKKIKSTLTNSSWGMNDVSCDKLQCPLCELTPFQQFHVRGICADAQIDSVYYLMPREKDIFDIVLMGYSATRIIWDASTKNWYLTALGSNAVLASTNDTTTLPLGSHNWKFSAGVCDVGGNESGQMLNLHLNMGDEYFCCSDGMCILWSLRCDNIPNCSDESDELECQILMIPGHYDETKPPTNKNMAWYSGASDNQPYAINVNFIIRDIYDINEEESTLTVRYTLARSWVDPRLSFRDLHLEDNRNAISIQKIWHPRFEYPSNMKQLITIEHHGVFVRRDRNFKWFNEKQMILKSKIFDGAENRIVMSETQQVEVFCNFKNLARYPFDEEDCAIEIAMKERFTKSLKIVPELKDKGPEVFSQYQIKDWTIKSEKQGSKVIITIKLRLHRNISMILLVVYLPTVMMTIINQSMNYLNHQEEEGNIGDFGNIIKVNISCMIVLSMIYNSVSTSLVPTPHIKMVEMWLISSLAYSFVCIIVNIRLRLIEKGMTRRNGTNIKFKTITVNRIKDLKNIGSDIRIPCEEEESFFSRQKEKTCLKFLSFYLLPSVYVLFVILYFTLVQQFYRD